MMRNFREYVCHQLISLPVKDFMTQFWQTFVEMHLRVIVEHWLEFTIAIVYPSRWLIYRFPCIVD